ncbi:type II toxin-antitoxin system RelB/DinJ family antitoxin [Raoultibacter phocaeensis]|uniref:type II toxin-antitoxin system RelB/DinJ family antitoxin n=1 Tax=Raoultibacter phocaeensis TaxID=2479841 RepID=UPI0011183342|nr:type II toxin-antitoxin system RelB/DinJ family antitoxin [Raoultibacter phocaeensis]
MATTKLVSNVDEDVKERAARLYESLGMTLSGAVNVFLRQSIREGGMPFRPTTVPGGGVAKAMPMDSDGYPVLGIDWDDPCIRYPKIQNGVVMLPSERDDGE